MVLSPGTRLGPYEIVSAVGAGGMGEVYRARDTKLGRDVAIKVLPARSAADPDRVARLVREARALAALNHPNIAGIHGLEDLASPGQSFVRGHALVMELVEGETLANRIGRAATTGSSAGLRLDEALALARQIADALGAAHERGIVHRDLKPENVKVTPDGTVKVLDFGLAKLAADPSETSGIGAATVTNVATREGLVAGTAAYMSPEQARGQAVDKRSDIWAFGCVLFESLSGGAVFARATLTDTLAAVVEREPDWNALPDSTPPAIRRLLQRCLAKDPRRRLHDIADARLEIDDALATQEPPATSVDAAKSGRTAAGVSTWRAVALALAMVLVLAGVWAAVNVRTAVVPDRPRIRFAVPLPAATQFPIDTGLPCILAISPSGDTVVYTARDATGNRLYRRRLDEIDGQPIPGTEGAIGPFFSPDGQSVGFGSGGMLKIVPLAGGSVRTLAEAPNLEGGAWAADDTIVFSPRWVSGLMRVSARGGKADTLTPVDEVDKSPHFLPDGRVVLFQVRRNGRSILEAMEIATGKRHTLVEGTNPVFVSSGHIVFGRDSALFAAPFDARRLELRGEPTQILDRVRSDGNDTHFAMARNGTLAYVPAVSNRSRLVWLDRNGRTRALDGTLRTYSHPRVSPDGARVVVRVTEESGGGGALWVYDVSRGTRAKLTPSGGVSRPIWTSGGSHITFQMQNQLYTVPADDSRPAELVVERAHTVTANYPLAWSRDRGLMFSATSAATNRDVWVLRPDGSTAPFLATPRDERAAMFSPDGKWVVYAVRETGREDQIYIQPYPGPGGRVVISSGGGIEPVWSPTGREVFYRSIDGTTVMAVNIRTAPALAGDAPRVLFAGRFNQPAGSFWSDYDVSPDGESFLMLEAEEPSSFRLNVVVGWASFPR